MLFSPFQYEKEGIIIILRVLNFTLVFKKSELFENLIFLDKLKQAIITVVSQLEIQNGTYQ